MKQKKTKFKFFTIPEWEKEQEYLRGQHKKGWKLTRIGGFCMYHFEKCQPEDVIYQLDFNPEGHAKKDAYVQMFRDCGWEYLQDYVGYSYFRKPAAQMDGEEEIFCDDVSRLDMMGRVFKGRMLPLLAIFFLIILPNLFLQSHLDTPLSRGLTWVFVGLFILYLVLFLSFGYQFGKRYRSMRK